VNGTLSVSPAALTITADSKSKLYGAALPALTASYAGFVNGDTASSLSSPVSLSTTATASSGVGTYPITASGASSPNYSITSLNGTLSVSPAALIITADSKSKLYGAALPALTASYAGFVNGDAASSLSTQVSLSTTATASSGVGTYPITASGASSPNYSITFVNGALSVSPAALTITADNKSRSQGTTNPAFTCTDLGWVNGDTEATLNSPISFTATATQSSPSGSYPIVVTGGANPNYSITFMNGTLTITGLKLVSLSLSPKSLTLKAGQTGQLTATGTYSDGSTQDLTASATWSSSNPTAAKVNAAGLVTTYKTGTATIRASSAGLTGSASITVTKTRFAATAEPISISIVPNATADFATAVTLSGPAGTPCLVEASTDLVNWESVATVTLPNEPIRLLDPAANMSPARFYRVRIEE
jgi:uncharacterized protein YjdB